MESRDGDWLLEWILDIVSEKKTEQALTVFCEGLIISGTAVPEETYFEGLGLKELGEDVAQSVAESDRTRKKLQEQADQEDLPEEERRAIEAELDRHARRFVHMRDVAIFGSTVQPLRAPVWRGRLSHVSGWVLGRFGSEEAAS